MLTRLVPSGVSERESVTLSASRGHVHNSLAQGTFLVSLQIIASVVTYPPTTHSYPSASLLKEPL